MRILIADDEEGTLILLRRSLEKMGHEIVECRSGDEVLAKLFVGELPQLVLLDWMMPRTDGIEVIRRIREKRELPFTYIILLTARNEREDVIVGLRAGANDYIPKPIEFNDLQSRLKVAVQLVELNNIVIRQRLRMISSAKMAVLGEMAAGVAHEINNPLTVVIGHAERLLAPRSGERDESHFRKSLEGILGSAKRIAKIIKAMRTFAVEGEKEPFDRIELWSVVEQAHSLCAARYRQCGVDLRLKSPSQQLILNGQAMQICQALLALLENAFLAVQDHTTPWIEIESNADSSSVFLSVTDSGFGIPEEIRAKIMQPFFTKREAGRGNGLGLSIAKGIAEIHGGTLKLDEAALNTRFVLSFPKAN